MGICGLVSGSYGAALVIQTAGCALLKGNEQIDYLFIYLFIYLFLFIPNKGGEASQGV